MNFIEKFYAAGELTQNVAKEIIALDDFCDPVISMVIEVIAKEKGIPVLKYYDMLRTVAEDVNNTLGEL